MGYSDQLFSWFPIFQIRFNKLPTVLAAYSFGSSFTSIFRKLTRPWSP
jgi:hypothetical protein